MSKKKNDPKQHWHNHQAGVRYFIKQLESRESGKDTREKFRDFCELAYCSLAKKTAYDPTRAEELEERYMTVVHSYNDLDIVRNTYPELLALTFIHAGQYGDFLGNIAEQINATAAEMGQFFTPKEVSDMMADMVMEDARYIIPQRGFITVMDPTAGAGVTLLSAARALNSLGYPPSRHMYAHAVDVSALAYKMGYIQLTAASIPAKVIRGNSLTMEVFETAHTPAYIPFIQRYGEDSIAAIAEDIA